MRVYLQWAKATAEDWQPLEVANGNAIRSLPRKGVPSAASVIDDNPGWLCGLNCQGIDFSGFDHTAIEVVSGGLRITGWQDDPEDFPVGERYAVEWTLMPPAPDPRLGGAVNTVQSRRVWAEDGARTWFTVGPVLPWTDFTPPPANMTLHGVWLSDASFAQHQAARTPHGWREWIGA